MGLFQPIQVRNDEQMAAALVRLLSMASVRPENPVEITSEDVFAAIDSLFVQAQNRKSNDDDDFGSLTPKANAATAFSFDDDDASPAPAKADLPNLPSFDDSEDESPADNASPFGQLAAMLDEPEDDDADPEHTALELGVRFSRTISNHKNILVISNLGIVTYQLKMALARHELAAFIAKGPTEGIKEFTKRKYTGIVVDLFLPTPIEGMKTVIEIKKIARERNQRTDVVVLMPIRSGLDMPSLKEIALQKGVGALIEKGETWYDAVVAYFKGE